MALTITPEIKDLIAAAAKAAVAEAMGTSASPPSILRIAEVMKRLGVSRTEIYRIIDRGDLKPRKQGSMTVFRADEVDAYVKNLPEQPARRSPEQPAVDRAA